MRSIKARIDLDSIEKGGITLEMAANVGESP
jgi:hypothetical protein